MKLFQTSCLAGVLGLMCGVLQATSVWADAVMLREAVNDPTTYRIAVQLQAKGKLKTPVKEDAAADLPLDVRANLRYLERRLPAAGRDDRAWRSLRQYELATSKIVVKEQPTDLQLSTPSGQPIVVEGQRSGLLLYGPEVPLQRRDVDLLSYPGDPLATLALLPVKEVEIGESWAVPEWAAQMFAGVEAATSARLTGKLLSANAETASLQFIGEVSGATTGAATTVKLNGTATFNRQKKILTSMKLIQQEQRGISTVSPGMEVTATIQWERQPFSGSSPLTDARLQQVPLDVPELAGLLLFQSRYWNIGLMHDRHWYVFQEIPEVAVLRLVESGSLISQCNIARIPKMRAGEHVAPEKFERDIKVSLGDQFQDLVDSQEIPSESGNYIYRVVASGGSDQLQMVWIYYLCAHPDGRQISFVFAVEQSNLEALNSRDISIVDSVEFAPAP